MMKCTLKFGVIYSAVILWVMLTASLAAALPLTIEQEINGEKIVTTFEKAPNRAVSLSQFSTEMLLALGLNDTWPKQLFWKNPLRVK